MSSHGVRLLLAVGCVSTGEPAELTRVADDVWARRVEDDLSIRLKLGLPVERMKTDPRFFESSPDGIRARLDRALEGSMTFGYYNWPTPASPVGLYYFNGSKTNERNLLFGLALMAHELVPGHHFQIARQSVSQGSMPLGVLEAYLSACASPRAAPRDARLRSRESARSSRGRGE